eukprot:CAMPEP_0206153702 /NCGR_PEP_ID=MMETSP1474-20131121/832_1 /ASSEMBLY_ACC=CAM_ASM_001110 /TAXON_ID=97495 /ORGANISM="Imantonia sp., Strain RCC918" /LENGTH=169 /DNA_ID=CAMNT_0053551625 /DNA_START=31 /DNA_END=541 /DNA_ORIENTATION=-
MGWEQAAAGFPELPVGKTVKQIWNNPAVYPLWAVIGLASCVCGGYMAKYFGGHTDIAWSKKIRATHDHNGLVESRVASHNSHFGFRSLNKMNLNIFPFKFKSMETIADAHRFDKTDERADPMSTPVSASRPRSRAMLAPDRDLRFAGAARGATLSGHQRVAGWCQGLVM